MPTVHTITLNSILSLNESFLSCYRTIHWI